MLVATVSTIIIHVIRGARRSLDRVYRRNIGLTHICHHGTGLRFSVIDSAPIVEWLWLNQFQEVSVLYSSFVLGVL